MSVLPVVESVELCNHNEVLYRLMLQDISMAKKSIHFEFYRLSKDLLGKEFRDSLSDASKRGVHVVVVLDAWGTGSSLSFFKPIIDNGGKVRIFNTFRLGTKLFTQSHRRNHRKILAVDDRICYFGSSNITHYSTVWRELMLRIEGGLAKPLRHIVDLDYKAYRKFLYNKKVFTRVIHFRGFEIIRDVPSIIKQKVMRKYLYLLKNATSTVYIETPYFLPGYRLRKAMADAVQRGVGVTVVLPRHSDVGLVDVLRNKYLGKIHKAGIEIQYYYPNNLHSKLLIVDDAVYSVGSSNFDYRSFRYMHEMVVVGKQKEILKLLLKHKNETLQTVQPFDYAQWKRRPLFEKILAQILVPFRYFF
jgi:cardiolipin synthase A/B